MELESCSELPCQAQKSVTYKTFHLILQCPFPQLWNGNNTTSFSITIYLYCLNTDLTKPQGGDPFFYCTCICKCRVVSKIKTCIDAFLCVKLLHLRLQSQTMLSEFTFLFKLLNYKILYLSLLHAVQILLNLLKASCVSFSDLLSAVFVTNWKEGGYMRCNHSPRIISLINIAAIKWERTGVLTASKTC